LLAVAFEIHKEPAGLSAAADRSPPCLRSRCDP
jgi:hypothetical protein